jgi:hypothetical protein
MDDLRQAIAAFAHFLRAHDNARHAQVVEDTLDSNDAEVPQRFMALFRHGMGGLLDVAVYTADEFDRDATIERDRLAEVAYQKANAAVVA